MHMVSLWPDISIYFFQFPTMKLSQPLKETHSEMCGKQLAGKCPKRYNFQHLNELYHIQWTLGVPLVSQSRKVSLGMNVFCEKCRYQTVCNCYIYVCYFKPTYFYIIITSWTYWRSKIGKLRVGYQKHLYFVTFTILRKKYRVQMLLFIVVNALSYN